MQSVAPLVPESSGQAGGQQGIRRGGKKSRPLPRRPSSCQSGRIFNPERPSAEVELHPVESTLPNGIDLIVETETLTPTITISGEIRHETALGGSAGKRRHRKPYSTALFSYGTTTLDRLAFQKALDDIAANESARRRFRTAGAEPFLDRGLQLLAENELSPALPEAASK